MRVRWLLLIGCFVAAASAQEASNLLHNGGFEGAGQRVDSAPDEKSQVHGVVAEGWAENSRGWAAVDADYELRTDDPHGGQSYQRIVGHAVREGRLQMMGERVDLAADAVYEAEIWMRSSTGTTASVLLRQPGAPYQTLGESAFRGQANWTRVFFRHSSRVAQPAAILVILDGPGTVDIDDARLSLAGDQSAAPARHGELSPWTRPGVGIPSGWMARGLDYDVATESKPGPFGPGAARLKLGPNGRLTLESMPFFLRFGVPHSLALSVRSEPAGAKVSLSLRSTDDGRGFGQQIEATTEWQRLVTRGPVALSADERHYVQLVITGDNQTLWLDGLSLREGEPAEAAVPPAVALQPLKPWGVFAGRDKPGAQVRVVGAPAGAKLKLWLDHVDGRHEELPAQELSGQGVDQIKLTPASPLLTANGLTRLSAQVVDGGGAPLSAASETLLAKAPPQVGGERPESPFGVHVTLREPDVSAVASLGFKWCRLHDASILTKWAMVEPRPGEWRWYDSEMQLARRRGLKICGLLCSSPPWASGHEQETGYYSIYYPPTDINQWREYVRRTVDHYKRWIDRWEVWNEPWGNALEQGFFRGGTPEQYAELLRAAYEEAKRADPTCTIVGIDTYDGAWDQAVLKAGAYGSYDVLSFHRYENGLAGGADDVFARKAAELAETQRKYGEPKPIENTEGGPGTTNKGSFFSFASPDYDGDWDYWADQVPRYYLGNLAAGVLRFYLYSLHNDTRFATPGSWMLTEPGNLCKPLTLSTSAMISFLEGAKWVDRLTPAPGSSAHWFEQPEKRWYGPAGSVVVMAVADGANPVPLTRNLPDGITCYDRWANPVAPPTSLGRAPVYLVASGAQIEPLRAALGDVATAADSAVTLAAVGATQ